VIVIIHKVIVGMMLGIIAVIAMHRRWWLRHVKQVDDLVDVGVKQDFGVHAIKIVSYFLFRGDCLLNCRGFLFLLNHLCR